jgi:hypothetical protein
VIEKMVFKGQDVFADVAKVILVFLCFGHFVCPFEAALVIDVFEEVCPFVVG